jgi:hypothetical protein
MSAGGTDGQRRIMCRTSSNFVKSASTIASHTIDELAN